MHPQTSNAKGARGYDALQIQGASRIALRTPAPKAWIDIYTIVPFLACVFALIVSPLSGFFNPSEQQAVMDGTNAQLLPRIFWPVMAGISIILVAQNSSRVAKLTWPPHIICLAVYLSFAGASILWSFDPTASFVRFAQQAMVVTSIILPGMLAERTTEMLRGLFLCFALALILNVFFVLDGVVDTVNCSAIAHCYKGYFGGKNYLGECAAMAFLLSLHEIVHRGWRRALGIIVIAIATVLVFLSDSKTAFGLIIISPFLAQLTLIVRKITRISAALILLSLPLVYNIFSNIFQIDLISRVAYILYNDSTFTGRTIIWNFVQYEIGHRPLLGWGYQSFWLVPGSLSSEAPGWVKFMPNAHNGYYDTTVEMGYVGLVFLYVFIIATHHCIGRVADIISPAWRSL